MLAAMDMPLQLRLYGRIELSATILVHAQFFECTAIPWCINW